MNVRLASQLLEVELKIQSPEPYIKVAPAKQEVEDNSNEVIVYTEINDVNTEN